MSNSKIVTVIITGDAKEEFDKLNRVVGTEIKNGIITSDNQTLFNSIKQKIELLKENPECGINIKKYIIPKKYICNYDVNNLWKINLASAWRMIYTIRGSQVEIICLILDLMNHKDYDKRFGYKRK